MAIAVVAEIRENIPKCYSLVEGPTIRFKIPVAYFFFSL